MSEHGGVPDNLRWALEVLRAAAPPRADDEGHYANRALAYLERLESKFRALNEYAPPEKRRRSYDDVTAALRSWEARRPPSGDAVEAAATGIAILAVVADVPPAR